MKEPAEFEKILKEKCSEIEEVLERYTNRESVEKTMTMVKLQEFYMWANRTVELESKGFERG